MSVTEDQHFAALRNMYLDGPINQIFHPRIEVRESEATIEMEVSERFFHAARAVHGSVYFKMLDDAAFFAANSLERERFVVTASFTTYFTKPVTSGTLRSVGKVASHTRSQFIAEAVLYDSEGKEVGRGSGVFVRSRIRLKDTPGYAP